MQILPTDADFQDLPDRSIVAFSARCARRVQPAIVLERIEGDVTPHVRAAGMDIVGMTSACGFGGNSMEGTGHVAARR